MISNATSSYPAVSHAVGSVRPGEWAMLLLLPVLAVAALGISVINQHGYVDPEYYTGYGQSFGRMWEVFGPKYFAARFPVIFVNVVSQQWLPGLGGYTLVRFLVFVSCAVPLYLLVRNTYGRPVALATYVFLLANPLLPRILCWDLTTFLAIPCALTGAVLWYASPQAGGPAVLGAGFLFGLTLASQVFTGTAILAFLLVETLLSRRTAEERRWMRSRLVALLMGGLLSLAFGLAFYWWQVGPVSPFSLWNSTWRAIKFSLRYGESHHLPFASYYAANYEMYVPVFTTLLLIVVNRARPLKDSLALRITWFSIAYLGAYVVAVFGLGMGIVQYFWYVAHLTIVVYLGIPVIIGRLTQAFGSAVAITFAAALVAVALVIRVWFTGLDPLLSAAAGNGFVVLALGVLCAVCLGGLLVPRKVVVLGCAALIGVVVQMPFLSSAHRNIYNVQANVIEAPLFSTIVSYHALLNRYDRPGQRVRTWHATNDVSLRSVSSSNLLFTLQDPWEGEGMPALGELERRRLGDPTTSHVLLMATSASDLEAGLRSLASAGVAFASLEEGRWGYPPLTVYARLVALER